MCSDPGNVTVSAPPPDSNASNGSSSPRPAAALPWAAVAAAPAALVAKGSATQREPSGSRVPSHALTGEAAEPPPLPYRRLAERYRRRALALPAPRAPVLECSTWRCCTSTAPEPAMGGSVYSSVHCAPEGRFPPTLPPPTPSAQSARALAYLDLSAPPLRSSDAATRFGSVSPGTLRSAFSSTAGGTLGLGAGRLVCRAVAPVMPVARVPCVPPDAVVMTVAASPPTVPVPTLPTSASAPPLGCAEEAPVCDVPTLPRSLLPPCLRPPPPSSPDTATRARGRSASTTPFATVVPGREALALEALGEPVLFPACASIHSATWSASMDAARKAVNTATCGRSTTADTETRAADTRATRLRTSLARRRMPGSACTSCPAARAAVCVAASASVSRRSLASQALSAPAPPCSTSNRCSSMPASGPRTSTSVCATGSRSTGAKERPSERRSDRSGGTGGSRAWSTGGRARSSSAVPSMVRGCPAAAWRMASRTACPTAPPPPAPPNRYWWGLRGGSGNTLSPGCRPALAAPTAVAAAPQCCRRASAATHASSCSGVLPPSSTSCGGNAEKTNGSEPGAALRCLSADSTSSGRGRACVLVESVSGGGPGCANQAGSPS